MALDKQLVSRWLDAYVQAWQTYDATAIGELFSEDATYAWHPWDSGDDLVRGRQQIVQAWLRDKDRPDSYQAEYAPLAVDGDLAIATGKTRYYKNDRTLDREYHNMFVLRFDDAGRCTAFTEWFMKTPS
jgi:ketosteroid isomerase-like protein